MTTVLVACQDDPDRTGTVAPPDQSPSVTSSPSTTPPSSARSTTPFPATVQHISNPVRIDLARLETGPPPNVQYVAASGDRQMVVLPGGRVAATLEVAPMGNEGYRHVGFAPYAGGWLALFDNMGPSAVLMGRDGSMGRGVGPSGGNMFSRGDRREIVFTFVPWRAVTSRLELATLGPSGLRRLGPVVSTAGFLGAHEVVATTNRGVVRVDTRDLSRKPVPGISSATMASSRAGWLIGEARGEHGVYDARTGAPVLGSGSYELLSFNPSGDTVAGVRARSRTVVMVFADVETGRVLRAFRWRSWDRPEQVVWEDERTLLADFVRFSRDGTVERPQLMGDQASPGVPPLLPPPVS
jgi:hypothetical protein